MNEEAGVLLLLLKVMHVTTGGGFTKPARIETACHYEMRFVLASSKLNPRCMAASCDNFDLQGQ